MSQIRTAVYISATSRDLRSARTIVADALLRTGAMPVSQDSFTAESLSIEDLILDKISACDAVICVVGFCYGWMPKGSTESERQRSITRMEFDIARKLEKPITAIPRF